MISPMFQPKDASVPPLRDGDRLTPDEFERRWDAMPNLKRAELIDGRVFLRTKPVSWTWHAVPHGFVMLPIGLYSAYTAHVPSGIAPSVRMAPRSIPQPDVVLRVDEECGGRSKIVDGFVVGSPEFIAEITDDTSIHDLREKKDLYERSGVQEYLNWSVFDEQITLFSWDRGQYGVVEPDTDGILKSRILPGLWFDPAAMVHDDNMRVMEVLHLGLQSPEHQAFVEELKDRQAGAGGHP